MRIGSAILLSLILIVGCKPDRKTPSAEALHSRERFLIITADDFGASQNINEGIAIAADKEAITSISVLANFRESLPALTKIIENHPEIGIGVHLNLTTGKPVLGEEQIPSLVKANGSFYTMEEILPVIGTISLVDLRNELRAQIMALVKMNIRIAFLSDQNGILTFYSPFFDVMLELAEEFKLPVRSPEVASIKDPQVFPNSKMNAYGRQIAMHLAVKEPFKAMSLLKYTRTQAVEEKVRKLEKYGIAHPDLLVDYFWGDPTTANLNYILEHLPDGISELILHLGTGTRQTAYPSGLDLDYFKNRENELTTILSDYLKEFYKYLNIKTIGYIDISGKIKHSNI